jgi:hypothetical protein
MTPEAWTFFTADSLALIALVGKGIDSYIKEKSQKKEVEEIKQNTLPISNGAIPQLIDDIGMIKNLMISLDRRIGRLEER